MIDLNQYIHDLVLKTLPQAQVQKFVTISSFLTQQPTFDYVSLTPNELFSTYQSHWTTNQISQTDLYSFLVHPQVADFFNDKINELAPIIYRQLMAKLAEGNLTNPNQITKLLEYLQKLTDTTTKPFAYVFVSPTLNQSTTPTLSPYKAVRTTPNKPQPFNLTPTFYEPITNPTLSPTPTPLQSTSLINQPKKQKKINYDEFFD